MKTSSSRQILIPLACLLLASCSGAKSTGNSDNKQIVSKPLSQSLVLADGITVTKEELDGRNKYLGHLKELAPDATPAAIAATEKILELGSPAEKFKNDGTMQAIMSNLDGLKTDTDWISLIRINKAISDKEYALGESKNKWICRLTRSTMWLCSVRGSLMHKDSGAKILAEAKSALAPLDATEERDFTGMENYQRGLK